MIKCVIFDFEDTLIKFGQDWSQTASKVKKIYIEAGISEDQFTLQHIYDATAIIDDFHKKISEIHPVDKIKHVESKADKIIQHDEIQGVSGAILLPNAIEILEHLKEKGVKIGIVTNNADLPVNLVIDKLNMRKYVNAIITRSHEGLMKPHPDHVIACLKMLGCKAEETILIGDGEVDMMAAKRAGVTAIGYLSQWNKKIIDNWVKDWQKKTKKSADIIINDLLEVRSLINR